MRAKMIYLVEPGVIIVDKANYSNAGFCELYAHDFGHNIDGSTFSDFLIDITGGTLLRGSDVSIRTYKPLLVIGNGTNKGTDNWGIVDHIEVIEHDKLFLHYRFRHEDGVEEVVYSGTYAFWPFEQELPWCDE